MACLLAVKTLWWWLEIISKEKVLQFSMHLIPVGGPLVRGFRLLVGNEMAEINVVVLDCVKFVQFGKVSDSFLVF